MPPSSMQVWFKRRAPVGKPVADIPAAKPDVAVPVVRPAEAPQPVRPPVASPGVGAPPASPVAPDVNPWPRERLAVTNQLWGRGFTMPGGEVETLRLSKPLGLSSASNLLLLGVGGGGPAGSVVRNFGTMVTGLEVEPALVNHAKALLKGAKFTNKAKIEGWDPNEPNFSAIKHHHCLAIEPMRNGGAPVPILDEISRALKLGGQLMMTELVAATPMSLNSPTAARWAELENRNLGAVPTANAITRMLSRVGFDVRGVEDVSARHIQNAMIGWRATVRRLEEDKPPLAIAARLVTEGELWLLRLKLLQENRLQMMRWHAFGRTMAR